MLNKLYLYPNLLGINTNLKILNRRENLERQDVKEGNKGIMCLTLIIFLY